jgi:hypothetical protein
MAARTGRQNGFLDMVYCCFGSCRVVVSVFLFPQSILARLTGQPDGTDMYREKPRGCAKLMVFGSRHAGFRLCDSGL